MDAPIYGVDGRIVAALDVSSARSDQTEGFNRLIAATVAQTARQIEADNLRAAFPRARIVFADHDESEVAMLLAVDADDIVTGATRDALSPNETAWPWLKHRLTCLSPETGALVHPRRRG